MEFSAGPDFFSSDWKASKCVEIIVDGKAPNKLKSNRGVDCFRT